MSQLTTRNTWLDQTPEILLDIISKLDQQSLIDLAIAYPEIFLGPKLNIFLLDAEYLLKFQTTGTTVFGARTRMITDEEVEFMTEVEYFTRTKPLLHTAIENNTSIPVIREILAAYKSVCPTSTDGIWGVTHVSLTTPLGLAARLRSPHIVSLLLHEGADPSVHYGGDDNFSLYRFPHQQCDSQDGTDCFTAMRAAYHEATSDIWRNPLNPSSSFYALEDCVLMIHDSGVPFPEANEADNNDKLLPSLKVNFLRVVKAILGLKSSRSVLYSALKNAVRWQTWDCDRGIIGYLISIGAPLIETPNHRKVPQIKDTLIGLAISRQNYKTAIFIVDRYMDLCVPMDFRFPTVRLLSMGSSEEQLLLVQALYRAMKKASDGGFGYLQGVKVSADALHNHLLTQVILSAQEISIQWLISRGVGTPGYLAFADLYALDRAISNALCYRNDVMWYAVSILVSYGATTLGPDMKETLIRKFEIIYSPMTYEESKQTITPDMLQPQYFTARSPGQLRALFHYLIEKCSG
ncbi:hypothetical protein F5Y03DRAFT_408035 [Xylaria venustula]|nr:hypothetical protein F5Y03DRAFT_408035 [Xylaria venustula]